MKGVRRVVVVNEVGEVCLKDFVKLADESEEIVVEKGCDRHEGGVVEIKRGGEESVREEDRHHKQVLVTVELSFVLCNVLVSGRVGARPRAKTRQIRRKK